MTAIAKRHVGGRSGRHGQRLSALVRRSVLVELTATGRRRRDERVPRRERLTAVGMALAFLAVAVPLAVLPHSARHGSLALLALLVGAYGLASLVEFEVGSGAAVPTQLVLVPMLFLLPLGWVPLAAAGGFAFGGLLCRAFRLGACGSPVVLVGSSWYALGPTLVLLATGEAEPGWSHWPVYLLAFAAQFAFDVCSTLVADAVASGARTALALRVMVSVYLIDVLLAPVGFVFALLAASRPLAVLCLLPLLALMALFARDRRARIEGLLELGETYRGTAVVLGDVIEADDAYTGDHSRGVQELCLAVADALGLDAVARREVEFAALLHDVGKLRIPKEIINKPGPLTADERAVIDNHTIEGERLLVQAGGFLGHVGGLVRSCHERHDGTGYPDRLAGEEIPFAARIVACCDAYDAMTSDRPYRKAIPAPIALAEVRAGAGAQFDPGVVDALVSVLGAEGPAPRLDASRAVAPSPATRSTAARSEVATPGLDDRSGAGSAVRERVRAEGLRTRAAVAPALSAYIPGGAFVAVAAALPLLVPVHLGWQTVGVFLGLAAIYAVAYGIQFAIGPGSAVPTQLAFVPMLVLLPPAVVPLAVGIAILARAGWDPNACTCTPLQRPFVLVAGGWYSVGPVALLLLTGGPLTLPLLLVAFASQVVIDATVTTIRISLGLGFSFRALAKNLAWTYVADLALTPAALLVAAPDRTAPGVAVAAVTGLLGFLTLVASDRQRHLRQVTGLADAYREAAERARRDALTGLTNRLGWDEALAALAADEPASVILLDVNGLKVANDARGHLFGDRLLVEVAATIQAGVPHADVVARLSGDEFGVLLVGENARTDGFSSHRLRSLFADHPGLDGHAVSAAVGSARVAPGSDPRVAFAAADRAVYAEKAAAKPSPQVGRPGSRSDGAQIAGDYAAGDGAGLVRLQRVTGAGSFRRPGHVPASFGAGAFFSSSAGGGWNADHPIVRSADSGGGSAEPAARVRRTNGC